MLLEQIKTGWGGGTNIEMGTTAMWLIQAITLIPWLASFVLIIVSVLHNDLKSKIITNIVLISLTILFIVLADLFMFL